ncbi:MAG: hypothetical protein QG603_182 [Patescibacteria group bacterium]|jgi:hypothetical protein|nr:hypothetical protein [Patescibacteria group bacterium]MDQ5970405.1 hypothetical protein [Patescibacteria group bacterium]
MLFEHFYYDEFGMLIKTKCNYFTPCHKKMFIYGTRSNNALPHYLNTNIFFPECLQCENTYICVPLDKTTLTQ